MAIVSDSGKVAVNVKEFVAQSDGSVDVVLNLDMNELLKVRIE